MISPPVCGCQYRICDTRRTPGSIPERAPVLPEEVHPSGIHLHADGLALGEPRHPLHAGDEADAAVAAGGDAQAGLRLVAPALEVLDDGATGAPGRRGRPAP